MAIGDGAGRMISVETVCQNPAELQRACHRVPAGTTIRALLRLVGPGDLIPRIESRALGLSLHGKRAWLDDQLAQGDRVEVMAPILANAKAERFARVFADRKRRRRGDPGD